MQDSKKGSERYEQITLRGLSSHRLPNGQDALPSMSTPRNGPRQTIPLPARHPGLPVRRGILSEAEMTLDDALAIILGPEIAHDITMTQGRHWAVVAAMAAATTDQVREAIATLRAHVKAQRGKQ